MSAKRISRAEVQEVLRALDKDPVFKARLVSGYPREVDALTAFRRRVGDRCVYIRNILNRIRHMELERGHEWLQDLRSSSSS